MSTYTTDSEDVESVSSDLPVRTEFDALVQGIRDVLGSSAGIDSDDVDVNDLIGLMQTYTSDPSHWKEYALEDHSRNYTRNLVDEGNGKANLLILAWTPGKGSLIHDHANAHCIMKVLKGSLEETLYDWPDKELIERGQKCPLQVKKSTRYTKNAVTYISDKIGLHRISNPDPNNVAVSLHLYTPPYAAKYGCMKFDEKTGKPTHIKLCDYYSAFGKREVEMEEGSACSRQVGDSI